MLRALIAGFTFVVLLAVGSCWFFGPKPIGDYPTQIRRVSLTKDGLAINLRTGTMGPRNVIGVILCESSKPDSTAYGGPCPVKVLSNSLSIASVECPILFAALQPGIKDRFSEKQLIEIPGSIDIALCSTGNAERWLVPSDLLASSAISAFKSDRLVVVIAVGTWDTQSLDAIYQTIGRK